MWFFGVGGLEIVVGVGSLTLTPGNRSGVKPINISTTHLLEWRTPSLVFVKVSKSSKGNLSKTFDQEGVTDYYRPLPWKRKCSC